MCGRGHVCCSFLFFFFIDTATTEIYTLSLHDALPIFNEPKPVAVTDANNNVVGAVHASKVIHVLFGSKSATKL